jgi:hypothetical protein
MTTSTARLKRIPSPHCSIAKMTPSTFGCRILPRSVAGSCPSYQPRLIACITAPHLYGRDGGARARPQPPPPRRRIKCEPSTRRASGPAPARPAPAMRPHARPAPALRPHAQLAPPAHQPARTRQPARASPPALARRSDPPETHRAPRQHSGEAQRWAGAGAHAYALAGPRGGRGYQVECAGALECGRGRGFGSNVRLLVSSNAPAPLKLSKTHSRQGKSEDYNTSTHLISLWLDKSEGTKLFKRWFEF